MGYAYCIAYELFRLERSMYNVALAYTLQSWCATPQCRPQTTVITDWCLPSVNATNTTRCSCALWTNCLVRWISAGSSHALPWAPAVDRTRSRLCNDFYRISGPWLPSTKISSLSRLSKPAYRQVLIMNPYTLCPPKNMWLHFLQ